ncbi:HdeD family acid-resistance protein [Streptomyces thinghirensis]|nr:HdeD family acid-resistance protein [Streptomyces thinghirensis]
MANRAAHRDRLTRPGRAGPGLAGRVTARRRCALRPLPRHQRRPSNWPPPSRTHRTTSLRVLAFISGAVSILLGLFCFRGPLRSVLLLALWIGIGWLFRGVTQILAAVHDPAMPARGWHIFLGAVTVVAGIVLIDSPVESAAVLMLFGGWWLVAVGVVEIVTSVRLRGRAHQVPRACEPPLRRASGSRPGTVGGVRPAGTRPDVSPAPHAAADARATRRRTYGACGAYGRTGASGAHRTPPRLPAGPCPAARPDRALHARDGPGGTDRPGGRRERRRRRRRSRWQRTGRWRPGRHRRWLRPPRHRPAHPGPRRPAHRRGPFRPAAPGARPPRPHSPRPSHHPFRPGHRPPRAPRAPWSCAADRTGPAPTAGPPQERERRRPRNTERGTRNSPCSTTPYAVLRALPRAEGAAAPQARHRQAAG